IGPLTAVIFFIPRLTDASNSARNIIDLENQMEDEIKEMQGQKLEPYSPVNYRQLPFQDTIRLKELSYQYPAGNSLVAGFSVGPIDLAIRKGELIFITGGNGSGKSSFLKLLTGLYAPQSGFIELDGVNGRGLVVNSLNRQQYRNLFSIIFSDYYLYDKIYGVEGKIQPAAVNALLENMGLPREKTVYENGAFTSIKLSSGQRKRLALAIAIFEDKPIYVFDEVAADLDPQFRDKFYFEILPELRARNKTVLVVSHDQQYWNVSDRLIHFQDGSIRELSREEVYYLASMDNRG
ncbi:MAG: ATP-binding cassette domain-containing protein, partial [Phaeodactylibacter sp.]|nr:ATP-binding cassette domain-containing protein [Phaeodactylibacter sp.]